MWLDPELLRQSLKPERMVIFGATVEIEDINTEAVVPYQLVGMDKTDIKEGRISVNSQIARALIGKEVTIW